MHRCPLCEKNINVRELGYGGIFTNCRICPECKGKIIVDKDSRYRYFLFIVISLLSLAFTVLLYFKGNEWLFPALLSYVVIGIYLWWATTRVYFIPFE